MSSPCLYFFTSGRSDVSRACTAALPRKRMEIGRIIGQAEQFLEDGEGLFALAKFLPTKAAAQSGVESGQPLALLLVERVETLAGLLQGGRPLAAAGRIGLSHFILHPRPGQAGLHLPAVDLVAGFALLDVVAADENDLLQFLVGRFVDRRPLFVGLTQQPPGRLQMLLPCLAFVLPGQHPLQPPAVEQHVASSRAWRPGHAGLSAGIRSRGRLRRLASRPRREATSGTASS